MCNLIRLVSIAMAVVGLLAPTIVGAAEIHAGDLSAAGLIASPAIFEVVGQPGTTVQQKFQMQNTSERPIPVGITLDRLRPTEQEIDLQKSAGFDASQWITVDEPYHILHVREIREVTARITVPKNAEPGGHYATILLQPRTEETGAAQSSARTAPQVGILVFITVPGKAANSLDARIGVNRLHWSKDVMLTAEFVNTGTVHALPTAKVVIKKAGRRVVAELPLKPQIVLPNTVRDFPLEWKRPALIGIYSAETVATYGPSQNQISSGKRYFIVVRWLNLIALLLVVVPLGRFVYKTHRRWPAAFHAFRDSGKR